MTSKEAIHILKLKFKDLLDGESVWLWNRREHDTDLTPAEDGKALGLAIKALEREEGWISVNDRLPKERDWYLGIFKENKTGWINPLPFVCDYVGHETPYTTSDFWILRGLTDTENPNPYYKDLVCVAWQLLPKPYEEEE